jgi:hypothetical protein
MRRSGEMTINFHRDIKKVYRLLYTFLCFIITLGNQSPLRRIAAGPDAFLATKPRNTFSMAFKKVLEGFVKITQ